MERGEENAKKLKEDGRWKIGDRRWEMGDGRWGVEMRNAEWRNRREAIGRGEEKVEGRNGEMGDEAHLGGMTSVSSH
jgi:hypothetical protein